MNKLVSVIIPTYNREAVIEKAIKSVLAQSYTPIEVIIVDDCSSDNTIDVINNEFGNDKRVIVHKLSKNSGACAARNEGVRISKGEYVAFLDSDDEFEPDKIRKQICEVENTKSDICISGVTYYRGDDEAFRGIPKGTVNEKFAELLYCNFATTGTIIGKRNCFIDNPFDVSLPRYQDWELIIRLFKKYKICFVNDSLLKQYYQIESITASTNHKKTYFALLKIYNDNIEDYKMHKKANSQINWLLGLHSIFLPQKTEWRRLLSGALTNGLNLKRLMVIGCAFMGMSTLIDKRI